MQDRYAGDIGDFGKLGLLRALSGGIRLGVGWYRTVDRRANNDGKHLRYLQDPARFRRLDPQAFDALKDFCASFHSEPKLRTITGLQQLRLLPDNTLFHSDLCPVGVPHAEARRKWSAAMARGLDDAQMIFLDPDNGIEPKTSCEKHALLSEIAALRRTGRTLVVYHHQTRTKGGAAVEFQNIRDQIRNEAGTESVSAVRLKPYSPRFYFLIDASDLVTSRLEAFATQWSTECDLFS